MQQSNMFIGTTFSVRPAVLALGLKAKVGIILPPAEKLVRAFVTSGLDFSSLLSGCPKSSLNHPYPLGILL